MCGIDLIDAGGFDKKMMDQIGSLKDLLRFFILLGGTMILVLFVAVVPFSSKTVDDYAVYFHFAILFAGLCCTLIYIRNFCRARGIALRDRLWIKFKCTKRKSFTTFFFISLAFCIFHLLGSLWVKDTLDIALLFRVENASAALWRLLSFSGLSLILVVPIIEEIIFRGFAYPIFRKRFGIIRGAVITSALFAIPHIFGETSFLGFAYYLASTFLVGIFLIVVLEKTKNLLWCIFFHGFINLLMLAAYS